MEKHVSQKISITKNKQETIAFAPIYNILPSDDVLDVDFNGHRLLPLNLFIIRYASHMQNLLGANFWTYESIMKSVEPKYILVCTEGHDNKGNIISMDTIPPENIFGGFLNTLLYMRLHKSGDIQMGTMFVSYRGNERPSWRNISHTDFICFMQNPQYWEYKHSWIPYELNLSEAKEILSFTNDFEQRDLNKASEILQATVPFSRAYNTADLFYKITNLVTVLESLLTHDGKDGEISFKLRARLVFLLKDKSISKFINEIYDIRSGISHDGSIKKVKFVKKFKEKNKKEFSHKELFEYVSRLEEICRRVIMYYIKKFMLDEAVSIQTISDELNMEMFSKLAVGK